VGHSVIDPQDPPSRGAGVPRHVARCFRHAIGTCWSVNKTDTKVVGQPACVYQAIDGHGQVVDRDRRRETAAAATFSRRASAAMGVIPDAVVTAGVAAYPPALAAALPRIVPETGEPNR